MEPFKNFNSRLSEKISTGLVDLQSLRTAPVWTIEVILEPFFLSDFPRLGVP